MSNPNLTDEQRQRRAETNRQNARKSTGPKSAAGKLASRLNGLQSGARTRVLDLSECAGLALLSREETSEYKAMVAEYARKLAPRDRVEMGIVQRIIDAQWRLLRNSRSETWKEVEGGQPDPSQGHFLTAP